MKIENTNLRISDGMYRPVGKPVVHTVMAGCRPLGRLGGRILYSKGTILYLGDIYQSADLHSKVRCAAITGPDEAIVMTDEGAVGVHCVDGTLVVDTAEEAPAVSLVAMAAGTVSTTVEKRTLSGNFTNRDFKAVDADALTGDLSAAYHRLCEAASGAGSAIQPALARYRLFDSKGRLIYTSQPVFLSHPDGAQCAGFTEIYALEGSTVAGYTLDARVWQLDVHIPAVGRDDIPRLDVAVTPLFHPFDKYMSAPFYPLARTSQTDPVARIALPGMSRATSGNYGATIVRESFARMEKLEKHVATIHKPFDGTARTVRVRLTASPDPMADTAEIKRVVASSVATVGREEALLSSPARFCATMVADSGAALMWSGLRALRPRPCSPAVFAGGSLENAEWGAIVAVRFRGNRGVTSSFLSGTGAFRELGAILSYPSSDAEEIGISISKGGKFYTGTFPLTPDASRRHALYMAPGLKKIELQEDKRPLSFNFEDARETLDGVVVFTDRAVPLVYAGHARLGGECRAVAARKLMNQAWDFGRSRFVAATSSALFSLGVSQAGKISVNKISERGVRRADAMTSSDDGTLYMILTAHGEDSGALFSLSPSGNLRELESGVPFVAVAWNSNFSELWALAGDKSCIIYHGNDIYRRDDVVPDSFAGCGETFGICTDGIAELSSEKKVRCRVARQVDFDVASYPAAGRGDGRKVENIRAVYLNIRGKGVEGMACVQALSIDGQSLSTLRSVRISGDCIAPLRLPLVVRLHRRLRLSFAATVGADFCFLPNFNH